MLNGYGWAFGKLASLLSQFHAATRAVNDRNERRRGARLHEKIESELP